MKTKQLIAAVALCGPLLLTNMQAQGLYLGLDLGYGFPAAKQLDYNSVSTGSGSTSATEYTSENLSLGKGMNAGLFVGYMFNKNMGAQLGVSYLIGGKTITTSENIGTSTSSMTEYIYKGSMIRLTPSIRMTVGEKKMKPYMKIGLIVGVGSKMTAESNYSGGSNSGQDIEEYKGGISLGFHGGLGINYALSDKLGLFGEIAGNYQNWAPKTSEITTSTYNGIDQMPGMDTRDKETEYLDSYTQSNSSSQDVNSPRKSQKFFMPFSSIGINIGLIITMGGGDAAAK